MNIKDEKIHQWSSVYSVKATKNEMFVVFTSAFCSISYFACFFMLFPFTSAVHTCRCINLWITFQVIKILIQLCKVAKKKRSQSNCSCFNYFEIIIDISVLSNKPECHSDVRISSEVVKRLFLNIIHGGRFVNVPWEWKMPSNENDSFWLAKNVKVVINSIDLYSSQHLIFDEFTEN